MLVESKENNMNEEEKKKVDVEIKEFEKLINYIDPENKVFDWSKNIINDVKNENVSNSNIELNNNIANLEE